MPKIKTYGKKLFGILGLPRSGTTLLNNIMNSYDNSLSLSEPHWFNIAHPILGGLFLKLKKNEYKKLNLKLKNNKVILKNLERFLNGSRDYFIGGVKETYREHQKESANYILKANNLDFLLCIFRKPEVGFSGWLKIDWGNYYTNVDNYIKTYKKFFKDIKAVNDKKIFLVKYENLCNEGVSYLNRIFDGYLHLDKNLEIKKTNFFLGDREANRGGPINKARMNLGNINENQIKKIRFELNEIYEGLN